MDVGIADGPRVQVDAKRYPVPVIFLQVALGEYALLLVQLQYWFRIIIGYVVSNFQSIKRFRYAK